jgi:hypothetical protein
LEDSEEAERVNWKKNEEKCQVQQVIKRRFGLFEGGRHGRRGKW